MYFFLKSFPGSGFHFAIEGEGRGVGESCFLDRGDFIFNLGEHPMGRGHRFWWGREFRKKIVGWWARPHYGKPCIPNPLMLFLKYCNIWDMNGIQWCCLLSLNWRNVVPKMVGCIYLTYQMWHKINELHEQKQVERHWCPKMLLMWHVQVLIWQFSNTEE